MNSSDVKKRPVFILKTEYPLLFLTATIRANGAVLCLVTISSSLLNGDIELNP